MSFNKVGGVALDFVIGKIILELSFNSTTVRDCI